MRIIVIVFIFSVSVSTHAFSTRWSCATDHLTTSYAMIEHDDHFELQAWHHNGMAFMPLHQGLITITDLDTLKIDAKVISPIGERYVLKFEKSECRQTANDWSCIRAKPTTINALMVNNLGFKAYEQTTTTRTSSFKSYVLRLSVELTGIVYNLPMEYSAHNCVHYPSPYSTN